jgi:hypothetical protein
MIDINDIPWIKKKSSQISAVAFVSKEEALFIKFNNNDIWQYTPFSLREWESFMMAESYGSYFYKEIKSKKKALKIGKAED